VAEASPIEQLGKLVAHSLAAGIEVEIEPLGVFYPDPVIGVRFEPKMARQVFIAYVKEDQAAAEWLYDALADAGFSPWMDVRKLLPGQNWPRAIEAAIETSDFFVACFSSNSTNKRGGFQADIRYALDCARRVPLDEIFLLPVRLDECRVPRAVRREVQWVDLFPDRARGAGRLAAMMRRR
jgi:hypothetical protein